MFNKEQYLWLEWKYPTPLNLLAILAHVFFLVYAGSWLIKLLPWPSF